MVYKRFIKRDGKLLGPYYYESYRGPDGKVHSRYLPNYEPQSSILENKYFLLGLLGVLSIILLLLIGNFNYKYLTGKVIESSENISNFEIQLAGKIANQEIVSDVDVRERVLVSSDNANKLLRFETIVGGLKEKIWKKWSLRILILN
jgi:hypothetical protein